MSENCGFDEKIEELKNYIIESTQNELSFENTKLREENRKLKNDIEHLNERNKELQKDNNAITTNDDIVQIVTNQIKKGNIYTVINTLFLKTFNENGYDCPDFWITYVNYYDDRKAVIKLLRFAGEKIPSELENIVLPHEWDEKLLDKFFDTMPAHYNCNGERYGNNLRFWNYRIAAHPFDYDYYTCYDEIPWQFVLRNPLLNSEKYAIKIAKAIDDRDNGVCFTKILSYQELDQNVLETIIKNIHKPSSEQVMDFLIENISFVKDKKMLDNLYSIIERKYDCECYILQMPESYQIKYVNSLDKENPQKIINFLNKTSLSKEKKMELLGNVFD